MDNVVQNIKLEDIIQKNFQNNDPAIIDKLAESIKHFGILEPLLVRPQNEKYEIILGNQRYQAAKKLGLETVPVLIKNMDDESFHQYLMLNGENKNTPNKFINNIPKNSEKQSPKTISIQKDSPSKKIQKESQNFLEKPKLKIEYDKTQTSDIVNLSELNKEEYERNDLKMNNEQFNSNVMNNNFGAPQPSATSSIQEPTFGGRFFPSLEDEPTNMNMGGINMNPTNSMPSSNNNLIDLTDIGMERDSQIPSSRTVSTPESLPSQGTPSIPDMNAQPMMNNSVNIPQPNEFTNPISTPTSNIVNIGNLQNENAPFQGGPIENQFVGNIPSSSPIMEPTSNIPQFDMSQNIAPAEFIQNQEMNSIPNMNENNFNMNPMNDFAIHQPEPMMQQPMQDFTMPTYNQEVEPQVTQMPINEPITAPAQDITPVIHTLKSLATNLEAFGYKIHINEENLTTSIKLTIEVEK